MSSMQLIVPGLGLLGHIAMPGRKIMDGPGKYELERSCLDGDEVSFTLDEPLPFPLLQLVGKKTVTVSRIGVQDKFASTYGVKSDGHVFNIRFWVFHREEQHPNTEFTGLFDTHTRQGHLVPVCMRAQPELAHMVFGERGFAWSKDFFGRNFTLTLEPDRTFAFYLVGNWPHTDEFTLSSTTVIKAKVVPPGKFHPDIKEPFVIFKHDGRKFGIALSAILGKKPWMRLAIEGSRQEVVAVG